ncbi:MAG TPA: GNAT family N-acetyltransferase [Trebonia sp.]
MPRPRARCCCLPLQTSPGEARRGCGDAAPGQAADPAFPAWVLTREGDGAVVGCTSVFEESPPWFWTEEERAEPAFFLATTVTDPAYAGQRIGALIAWTLLGHAARTGRAWVRRGTTEPGLVRYYRDVQGWSVIREKERDGFLVTGLARRAELQPGLPARVAS